jgi:hypothetical protein
MFSPRSLDNVLDVVQPLHVRAGVGHRLLGGTARGNQAVAMPCSVGAIARASMLPHCPADLHTLRQDHPRACCRS